MELSTTKSIKTAISVNDISNYPKLHGVISDLRNFIDEYNFKSQELIIKIAKRLDEGSLCERSKISQVIKKILKDKIQEGKITKKWIEECLPRDYKRKYIIKSELNSLSSKRPEPKTVGITNNYCEVLDTDINSKFQSDKDFNSQNKNKLLPSFEKKDEYNNEIKELKEIIDKYEKFIIADQIFNENTEFIISRDKFQLLKDEIDKSKKECYLKFDKNKVVREIHSDT